jgi:hypothetical protein
MTRRRRILRAHGPPDRAGLRGTEANSSRVGSSPRAEGPTVTAIALARSVLHESQASGLATTRCHWHSLGAVAAGLKESFNLCL